MVYELMSVRINTELALNIATFH